MSNTNSNNFFEFQQYNTNNVSINKVEKKTDRYFKKAEEIIDRIMEKSTMSQAGGLPYLLFGPQPSAQSLYIKIGRNFEEWFKYIVEDCGMKLLPDGVVDDVIDGKSKDIDFLFMDTVNKIVYYRELKSNLDLDTEKLPATYEKIKKITKYIEIHYPSYRIDSSLMTWAVFEKSDLPKKYNTKIKYCNNANVSVSFPSDLFQLVGADIDSNIYWDIFRKLGKKIQSL